MSSKSHPSSLQHLVRRIFWRHRWLLFTVGLSGFALQGVDLVFPFLTKLQLDQLNSQHTELFGLIASSPFNLFIGIIIVYILAYQLNTIIDKQTIRIGDRLSFVLARDFISETLTHLKQFDASLLTGKRNQLIVSGLRDGNMMFLDLWSTTISVIKNCFSFVILLPLITRIDPSLFIVLVVINGIALVWNMYSEKVRRQLDPVNDRIRNKLWATDDVLGSSSLHDLYLIGGENRVIKRHQQLQLRRYLHERNTRISSDRHDYVRILIEQAGTAIIAIMVARAVFNGSMTIGTFTMITLYAGQLNSTLGEIFYTITNSVELRIRWRKFRYLYTLTSGYQDPIGPAKPLTPSTPITLALHNVSFRYPNMAKHERQYLRYLLKDVNVATKRVLIPDYLSNEMKSLITELTHVTQDNPTVLSIMQTAFQPGTISAIVGENGAGKSTLVKLLMRSYDPTKGSVTINNEPYVNYQPAWLRQRIAYLSQEPFLIDGLSVHENLVLGCAKIPSPKTVKATLKTLGMLETVNALPKKIHSSIGSDTDLSGGQRQLLAVARVILQDRPVLIMDEGSSQLDALRELALLRQLRRLATKRHKTVIIVTHRLTTARHADMIYVLHRARLHESGTHAALLHQPNGFYNKLWRAQTVD